MATIDEYFQNVNPKQKVVLERIRKLVKQMVPDATEVISYGVPTLKYEGTYLIYFAAYKNHMSIYPTSDAMVAAIGEELGKFRTSKGTLQFTEKNPIPEPLIKQIINYRLAEINNR